MIAKAKAISHGGRAIEYAMRESKKGDLVRTNLVQNETSDEIYKEFLEAQKYNTRCKNKFIRIEIGIAPQDEAKLTMYDTSFISKRAGKIAEEISREMGLTIANEVTRKEKHKPEITNFERMMARARIEKASNIALKTNPKSLKDFTLEMKKQGINVTEAKNKKGNTYGLRFSGYGQTFKASQIGKEYGYRTLLNTFSENTKSENQSLHQEQNPNKGTSLIGEVLSGLGSIISPDNYSVADIGLSVAEEEERKRKLKKKRRYGRQQ